MYLWISYHTVKKCALLSKVAGCVFFVSLINGARGGLNKILSSIIIYSWMRNLRSWYKSEIHYIVQNSKFEYAFLSSYLKRKLNLFLHSNTRIKKEMQNILITRKCRPQERSSIIFSKTSTKTSLVKYFKSYCYSAIYRKYFQILYYLSLIKHYNYYYVYFLDWSWKKDKNLHSNKLGLGITTNIYVCLKYEIFKRLFSIYNPYRE